MLVLLDNTILACKACRNHLPVAKIFLPHGHHLLIRGICAWHFVREAAALHPRIFRELAIGCFFLFKISQESHKLIGMGMYAILSIRGC
jgi:hypothetical protein